MSLGHSLLSMSLAFLTYGPSLGQRPLMILSPFIFLQPAPSRERLTTQRRRRMLGPQAIPMCAMCEPLQQEDLVCLSRLVGCEHATNPVPWLSANHTSCNLVRNVGSVNDAHRTFSREVNKRGEGSSYAKVRIALLSPALATSLQPVCVRLGSLVWCLR